MDSLSPLQQSPIDDTFNEWLFGIIRPFIKGRVLEINSSLNSISNTFVEKGLRIHLSSSDKTLREQLLAHYKGIAYVAKVHSINVHRPDFEQAYEINKEKLFDTILILNAMVDGMYNQSAIQHASYLLRKRGIVILLAPLFTAFYNEIDLDLNEIKAYNRESLGQLLSNDMEILMVKYVVLKREYGYDRTGLSSIVIAKKL